MTSSSLTRLSCGKGQYCAMLSQIGAPIWVPGVGWHSTSAAPVARGKQEALDSPPVTQQRQAHALVRAIDCPQRPTTKNWDSEFPCRDLLKWLGAKTPYLRLRTLWVFFSQEALSSWPKGPHEHEDLTLRFLGAIQAGYKQSCSVGSLCRWKLWSKLFMRSLVALK